MSGVECLTITLRMLASACSAGQALIYRESSKVNCHLFVSCEHPDSDTSIGQALDGLWHACLQLVLNGSAAQQQQVPLYQVPDCCKLLLTPCQGGLGLEVLLLPPVVCACSLITAVHYAADNDTNNANDIDIESDHHVIDHDDHRADTCGSPSPAAADDCINQ